MELWRMQNLNFIFSIFFIPWCILHLFASSREESHFHQHFGYGFKEKELNIFWSLVVFLTMFNLVARFTRGCNYYLFGAAGMILLCFAQFIFVLVFLKTMMSGFSDKNEKHLFYNRLVFILLTFPYIFFGIQSSLFCYQLKINEKADQNQTKFQRMFLTLFFINFPKMVLLFNLAISFSVLLLVIMGIETTGKIGFGTLILLVPFIPTMFILMAYFSKQKKYYEGAILTWGILAAFFIFFLFVIIKHGTNTDEITTNISIMFICIINSIVGCFSAASCQNEKNFENTLENPNYVSYDVDADAVVL